MSNPSGNFMPAPPTVEGMLDDLFMMAADWEPGAEAKGLPEHLAAVFCPVTSVGVENLQVINWTTRDKTSITRPMLDSPYAAQLSRSFNGEDGVLYRTISEDLFGNPYSIDTEQGLWCVPEMIYDVFAGRLAMYGSVLDDKDLPEEERRTLSEIAEAGSPTYSAFASDIIEMLDLGTLVRAFELTPEQFADKPVAE